MKKEEITIFPYPKKIDFKSNYFAFKNSGWIYIEPEEKEQMFFVAKRLQRIVEDLLGLYLPVIVRERREGREAVVFKKDFTVSKEGYILNISPEKIYINYSDAAGAFYAVSTLKQIIWQCGKKLPCLKIEDEPDFQARGIMLDISRDKIPTMETLYKIVDFMADIKLNQLQLYIEGFPFAYPSYPSVWADQTPVTGEEIIELDRYCRERFIELVPNQNSFGHMTAWLSRREFNDLAECPQGYDAPWGRYEKPGTLNPLDERVVEFLERLYDDLLPNFSSKLFNVGCDETFELGKGKSKELCNQLGTGRVYLDFLMKIYDLVKRRGKKMMFWGDIIINYPELVCELPKDVIVLDWGYEAKAPFEEHGEKLEQAGIPFYVCPGTSSWNSIAGRTENMKQNLLNAAINGKKFGASGYLNTDWGDNGHWQYLPVSYAGFSYGAALSWNVEGNKDVDIADYLNKFVFCDRKKVMGQFVLELGNYYLKEGRVIGNATNTFRVLLSDLDDYSCLNGLNKKTFESIKEYMGLMLDKLEMAEMQCSDAELVDNEFRNAIRFIQHGADLGLLKLFMRENDINKEEIKLLLAKMIDDISVLIKNHSELWLKRNRMGGLKESIRRLEELKAQYIKKMEEYIP